MTSECTKIDNYPRFNRSTISSAKPMTEREAEKMAKWLRKGVVGWGKLDERVRNCLTGES